MDQEAIIMERVHKAFVYRISYGKTYRDVIKRWFHKYVFPKIRLKRYGYDPLLVFLCYDHPRAHPSTMADEHKDTPYVTDNDSEVNMPTDDILTDIEPLNDNGKRARPSTPIPAPFDLLLPDHQDSRSSYFALDAQEDELSRGMEAIVFHSPPRKVQRHARQPTVHLMFDDEIDIDPYVNDDGHLFDGVRVHYDDRPMNERYPYCVCCRDLLICPRHSALDEFAGFDNDEYMTYVDVYNRRQTEFNNRWRTRAWQRLVMNANMEYAEWRQEFGDGVIVFATDVIKRFIHRCHVTWRNQAILRVINQRIEDRTMHFLKVSCILALKIPGMTGVRDNIYRYVYPKYILNYFMIPEEDYIYCPRCRDWHMPGAHRY